MTNDKWLSNFTRIVKTQLKYWKFHVSDVILDVILQFSRDPIRNFLVLLQMTNYILNLE